VGFRNFHGQVKGSSDDRYPQFVSPNQSMVILSETGKRLCLAWKEGQYETQKQWWWDYKWVEEAARGEPDSEDLFLVGTVSMKMEPGKEYSLGASFENAISMPDTNKVVEESIARQSFLVRRASLPRSIKTDMLVLACDQFIVPAFEEQQGNWGRPTGVLTTPMKMTLERAIEFIGDDELVEVTPESIRLRKAELDPNLRKRKSKVTA
jgi:hypothetical protein